MFTYLDDRGSSRYSRAAVTASRRAALAMTTIVVLLLVSLYACGESAAVTSPGVPSTSASIAAPMGTSTPIPGQYIVTFTRDVSDVPGTARRLIGQAKAVEMFTYTAALHGFAAKLSAHAAAALANDPQVARVEQDAFVPHAADWYPLPWNLDRIDQRTLPYDHAYGYAATGAGVNVYILDAGLRTTHLELGGRAYSGYSAINDGMGTTDCYGHGTYVAGVVGGSDWGVAKQANLYAVRVLDCSGAGTYSGIIAGVDWVTAHRVLPAVANMSLHTPASTSLNAAVANSIAAGVVYVVAAGNQAGDACSYSPASAPGAITVGATTSSDAQASYSNFGPCVDIYAPGDVVTSAGSTSDTTVMVGSGTSASAPHVAGAAALYLQGHPTATPAQVTQAILSTATPGLLSQLGQGSPNLLLYTGALAGGSTSVPPPIVAPAPAPAAPPTANFITSCAKSRCNVDASASTGSSPLIAYAWDFGDGSATVSGPLPTEVHRYPATGTYVEVLTITDSAGLTATAQRSVKIRKL